MPKVFIDGNQGTTGLRIVERLSKRSDIQLVTLCDELRKDINARKEMLNSCDISVLCLPDDAAREAVKLVENPESVIIDTSTAHRTSDGWTYGFCELGKDYLEAIKSSKRIANPGCHASGFVAIVYPLVKTGILNKNAKISCFSVTGYSGGGKKMISQYETDADEKLLAPRQYGLTQNHKHLKEMKKICSLENEPIFSPIVSNYYSGMEVSVPLFSEDVNGMTLEQVKEFYKSYYTYGLVAFEETSDTFTGANLMSGLDNMAINVNGNDSRMVITARFDNLGKGASGSAIENLNIVLGKELSYSLKV